MNELFLRERCYNFEMAWWLLSLIDLIISNFVPVWHIYLQGYSQGVAGIGLRSRFKKATTKAVSSMDLDKRYHH